MEWKLSSELKSATTTFEMKLQEARAEALRSQEEINHPVIRPFEDTKQIADDCFKKPPQVFHMIDHAFGKDTNEKFLAYMARKYKFSNAGLKEWKTGYVIVTGQKAAGDMLESWFTKKGFPILVGHKTDNSVIVNQKTAANDTTIFDEVTFPLKVEFIDSNGKSVGKLMSNKALTFESDPKASWFLLDPNNHTFSRSIYSVSNYESLIKCYNKKSNGKTCPKLEQIKSAFNDFCWGLYHDQFPVENDRFDKKTWELLFENLNNFSSKKMKMYCDSCLKTETELNGENSPPWQQKVWVEKCQKLKIMGLLDRKYKIKVPEETIMGFGFQHKVPKEKSRVPR